MKPYVANGFDEAPAAQATWNLKDEQKRMLADKLDKVMTVVAKVKIYDQEAIKSINAMLEVIYEVIRPGLSMHYHEYTKEMDLAFKLSKQLFYNLNMKSSGISELTEFVESVEYCYRALNKALYMTGLGITLEQKLSQKQMVEQALLE